MAEWKVWGFTAVIYRKHDYFMFFMGLISLIPQVIILGFIASDITKIHRPFLVLQLGMAINEAINFAVKELVREGRPVHSSPIAMRDDYGMPSSHSQFMFFLATRTTLLFWSQPSRRNFTRSCTLFLLAAAVSYSRIINEHHFIEQVVVGAVVGTLLGFALSTKGLCRLQQRCVVFFVEPVVVRVQSLFV